MVSLRRWLPLMLVLAGGLLVGAGGLLGYIERRTARPQPAPLPPRVGGLPLVAQRVGPVAAEEIAGMHRNPFPMSAAAVGEYRGAFRAQVWVSGMPFRWMAARMVRSMARRIETLEDQPFRLLGVQRINGVTVYQATGLGQEHYFFASGPWVVWLGVDAAVAQAALEDILAFYGQQR